MPTAPLVSVLVAVHDGERYLRPALASILRQSVRDLELLVVDDGSTDSTPGILEAVVDPRLRVLRNDERRGLAASLNRGLDDARGRYVARMDGDDIALPDWLEQGLRLLGSRSGVGFVGTGVLDIDAAGRPQDLHVLDSGAAALRWRALFSAPVFHDTVVIERDLLEERGLRYNPAFGESEDYDFWTRVLAVCEGDAVEMALVLHRLHPDQASRRRTGLQQSLAHEISLRQIAALSPSLASERAALARAVGIGAELPAEDVEAAAEAYGELVDRFGDVHAYSQGEQRVAREAAARALARVALQAEGAARARVLLQAARLDPLLPAHAATRRARRRLRSRDEHRAADELLRSLSDGSGIRIAAIFPEPTPYRAPLLDCVSDHPDVDLTVIYAAETVAARTWRVRPHHRAVFLHGVLLPGARGVLHHEYPLTPGVVSALGKARPDVVVVSGWSTFAAQAAITWCRLRGVPYVLVVESHDEGPRPGWRRKVKGAVVPPIVRGASGALVTGTLARRSMIARGAEPGRVRIFANTVDVGAFGSRTDELADRRPELRAALGASAEDVVVLSVARLLPEKGHDVLIRAVAEAGDRRLVLVLVGDGPERERLQNLASELGVRLVLTGDWDWERIVEVYVAADVFALLSEREPWAVVVNEAAACGLPLVLSDRVGAAHDLLRDGENGALVAAGDVAAAARALRELAADESLRRARGACSRELASGWGYGPSIEGFLEAVRGAVTDHR